MNKKAYLWVNFNKQTVNGEISGLFLTPPWRRTLCATSSGSAGATLQNIFNSGLFVRVSDRVWRDLRLNICRGCKREEPEIKNGFKPESLGGRGSYHQQQWEVNNTRCWPSVKGRITQPFIWRNKISQTVPMETIWSDWLHCVLV